MEKQRENLSFEIDENELEVYEKFKHSQIATWFIHLFVIRLKGLIILQPLAP